MKKQNIPWILVIAAALVGLYLYKHMGKSVEDKKAYLLAAGVPGDIVSRMTAQELSDSYEWLADYKAQNKPLSSADPLFVRLTAIVAKYNIFS